MVWSHELGKTLVGQLSDITVFVLFVFKLADDADIYCSKDSTAGASVNQGRELAGQVNGGGSITTNHGEVVGTSGMMIRQRTSSPSDNIIKIPDAAQTTV